MKIKVFLVLFLGVISQCAFAQKHMKFMGIPIDGNVDVFCEKLSQNGFVNNECSKDIISLKGLFYGEESLVDVHFDASTKIVYEVSVSIIKEMDFLTEKIQKSIMNAIEEKYKHKKETVNPKLMQYNYYIFDQFDPIGMIQTFIIGPYASESLKESMLSLTYIDVENYLMIERKKRNDI